MKVVKELTFDAAHMLSNYSGKCNNLHGHTYRVLVELVGPVVDDMVMDFNAIKEYFDKFDHAIIFAGHSVREPAESDLYHWACMYNKKYYVMPQGQRPTAENMAQLFEEELTTPSMKVRSVKVWETPTAYAEA